MDVHLRDLRYFVGVADELSFTRAAERLMVSQPALSKQIRQLESMLGAPLFERDHRHVSLTPAGSALLSTARQLVGDWDTAVEHLEQLVAAEKQTLTVGMLMRSRTRPVPVDRTRLRRPTAGLATRLAHARLERRYRRPGGPLYRCGIRLAAGG